VAVPKEGKLAELQWQRKQEWRDEGAIERIERPTRLDKARELGYKAKQGVVVARVSVRKGGSRKQRHKAGRRSKRQGVNRLSRRKSIQRISEERAPRASTGTSACSTPTGSVRTAPRSGTK